MIINNLRFKIQLVGKPYFKNGSLFECIKTAEQMILRNERVGKFGSEFDLMKGDAVIGRIKSDYKGCITVE